MVHYNSVAIMGTKKRTVINADARQIERVGSLVTQGRYRTVSDFVREAVDEKLARIEDARLEDEVARYCAEGHADEDTELIAAQAFDPDPPRSAPRKKKQRASR